MTSHFTVEKAGPDAVDLDFDVISTNKDVTFLTSWLLIDVEYKHFISIEHLAVILVHLCVIYQMSQLGVNC